MENQVFSLVTCLDYDSRREEPFLAFVFINQRACADTGCVSVKDADREVRFFIY